MPNFKPGRVGRQTEIINLAYFGEFPTMAELDSAALLERLYFLNKDNTERWSRLKETATQPVLAVAGISYHVRLTVLVSFLTPKSLQRVY